MAAKKSGKKTKKKAAKKAAKSLGAKRGKKKAARKPAKAAKKAAKPAKKAAKPAKKAAKTRKASAPKLGPSPVKTGSGATPMEIAQQLVSMMREGRMHEAEETLLAPSIESVEGVGASMAWQGKKAVFGKYRAWEADHEIHDFQIGGPWVGATGFAVRYNIDVTQKSTGQRNQMEEIAVYTVKNGKIVREEFHFGTGG